MYEVFISCSMLMGTIRWVRGPPAGGASSDVKVGHLPGMTDNEILPYFHIFSPQRLEDLVGFHGILDIDLLEDPVLGIHGGVPELVCIHLTKTLVPLDGDSFLAHGGRHFLHLILVIDIYLLFSFCHP